MNVTAKTLSRRTMLRGLGTAVALPLLDGMLPRAAAATTAAGAATPPVRMAFIYIPNGVNMDLWRPTGEGADFTLPKTLEPLAAHRDRLTVLSGLAHHNAKALGDGGGDHARSASCFLTGSHPVKTDGADIHVGVSVDQVAASRIGDKTLFPSLELGIDRGAQSGNCDSGYSCAYSSNISWRTPTQPIPKDVNPRSIFERLYGSDDVANEAARAARRRHRKSVLDFVLDDTARLASTLGANDRRKLDEYLSAVREVETRIQRAERIAALEKPDYPRPEGQPDEYDAHVRLVGDLLTLAFQGDLTRVATFMFGNAGSNRSYRQVDVPEGHHHLSHHDNDETKLAKIGRINRFHVEQFAYLLDRLSSVPEGDGTLLDNSMIVYGSAISDGNRHNHDDLPVLLAGRGGGAIQSGRHVVYPERTPMSNLFVSMLDIVGAPVDAFGDSTAPLNRLDG